MTLRGCAFCLVLVTMTGCAYRTPAAHLPASMPAALDASDVTVVDAKGPIDDETVSAVRRDTTAILLDAAKARPAGPGGSVVHAHVTLEEREDYVDRALSHDGIAIFGLWPVAFGMKNGQQKLSVDVEVETSDGRTLHGHGAAEKEGSLYAHARRRALAVALDRALADAVARR